MWYETSASCGHSHIECSYYKVAQAPAAWRQLYGFDVARQLTNEVRAERQVSWSCESNVWSRLMSAASAHTKRTVTATSLTFARTRRTMQAKLSCTQRMNLHRVHCPNKKATVIILSVNHVKSYSLKLDRNIRFVPRLSISVYIAVIEKRMS